MEVRFWLSMVLFEFFGVQLLGFESSSLVDGRLLHVEVELFLCKIKLVDGL